MGWPKGKINPAMKGENNPMKRPELRKKQREFMRGKPSPMEGKKHTPEANQKNREKHLGKKCPSLSEYNRKRTGENNPMWGKKRPDFSEWVTNHNKENNPMKCPEIAEKASKAMIGAQAGEKHPNWKGGISFEPYGIEFNKALKEQIRKRDNYQCQECGIFQIDLNYKLPVHHIDFNKKNNEPINLISLCKSCHAQTGYGRDDWAEYYKNKLPKKIGEEVVLEVSETGNIVCEFWTSDVKDIFCNLCSKKDTSECNTMTCAAANPYCG